MFFVFCFFVFCISFYFKQVFYVILAWQSIIFYKAESSVKFSFFCTCSFDIYSGLNSNQKSKNYTGIILFHQTLSIQADVKNSPWNWLHSIKIKLITDKGICRIKLFTLFAVWKTTFDLITFLINFMLSGILLFKTLNRFILFLLENILISKGMYSPICFTD